MYRISLLLFVTLCAGCNSHTDKPLDNRAQQEASVTAWTPPAPGAVVDEYEEAIPEDKLNNAFFKVAVVATSDSKEGHYDLRLEYGGNKNQTAIDLPKWPGGISLKPVLQNGAAKYECQLGFDAGDGVFKPLYLVSVKDKNIKLKQTNYYYISK